MVKVDLREIVSAMDLPDGRRLIILNWTGRSENEAARNLYLVGADGQVVWQVASKFDADGGPFTKLHSCNDEKAVAYRWDGGDYEIDMKTGFAIPKAFKK